MVAFSVRSLFGQFTSRYDVNAFSLYTAQRSNQVTWCLLNMQVSRNLLCEA